MKKLLTIAGILAVDHSPVEPAVGYRFSYKGRSLLITGDTTKQANIQKFSEGIDLLVHEALAPNLVNMMNGAEDIFPNYTSAQDDVAFTLPANSNDIIKTSDGP